jgi:hypothetical protein
MATVKKDLVGFIDNAQSRNFDALILHLSHRGITVDPTGPGSHVIERCIQTIRGMYTLSRIVYRM